MAEPPRVHLGILALGAANCTGCSAYPVTMHRREGVLFPGFHGLVVTGRCPSVTLDLDPAKPACPRVPS